MGRTILLTCLILVAPYSYAEKSWFDSALEFFGMASSEEEAAPPTEQKLNAKESQSTALEPMSTAGEPGNLANMVTDQLGVTEAQAQGGLGTLFGLAKSTLGQNDFGKLSGMIPDMDKLLAAAPALSDNAKGLSSLMGKAGKYGNALQGATQAYSQFKSLGLGVDQIPQYITVTNNFLESKGGDETVEIFKEGISSLIVTDG